jgi:hypothetical protein
LVSRVDFDPSILDQYPDSRRLADCIKKKMVFSRLEDHSNVRGLLKERRSGNPVVNELLGPYPVKPGPS